MLDAAADTVMQRARGRAQAGFVVEGGATRLKTLHQSGAAKAMLPRCHAGAPEVVFLNTSGGVTGGDRLDYALDLDPGAQVTASTQTAERAYRAAARDTGQVQTAIRVGEGARLDWLPQEIILFDGSRTERRLSVDLAPGAELLMSEMVVFGRAAMGETLSSVHLRDERRVTREGAPLWREPIEISADDLAARAGFQATRAIATVAFFAETAPDRLAPLRRLNLPLVEWAASAWDGRLLVRIMGAESQPVKLALAAVLCHLRAAPLPRVWQL